MRLWQDLVSLPLDQDVIVFSEEAQSLFGLNSSAAFILGELQKGISVSEIVRILADAGGAAPEDAAKWVATTVDGLAASGVLIDGSPRPPIFATAQNEDEAIRLRAASMPPFTAFTPVVERCYQLLDVRVRIRFAMWSQAEVVDAVIGHLAVDDSPPIETTFEICGTKLFNGRVRSDIYRNGQPVNYLTGNHRLGPIVKSILWSSAVAAHDFLFNIHAGVIGTGESCVLLPAATGSGKSTLTAALTHRGFRYYSDEVALVEASTFRVPPMPLGLCAKSTSWELMARYFPEIRGLPAHERTDGKLVRYIPPPRDALRQESAPVSHIIFPRYEKDAPTELKPVARSEALGRLMGECLAIRHRLDQDNVEEIVRWIAGIDCYSLTFSSLDEAVDRVVSLLGQPSPG